MLNVESKLARMWAQAVCAALEGGKNGGEATAAADYVAMSYASRFGQPAADGGDGMIGATVSLRMATEFIERSRLIGQTVAMIGYVDLPPMATIKDFSDGSKFHQDLVLVHWTSSKPVEDSEEETWVQIDKLVLVKDLDSLCT